MVTSQINYEDFIATPPYSLEQEKKEKIFQKVMLQLTKHHYENCALYKKLLDTFQVDVSNDLAPKEIPFIPVRLFKDYDLVSVDKKNIVKTITSSGTSNQGKSRINLDRHTSVLQSKSLSKIVSSFTNAKRLPLLVFDSKSILREKASISARSAGILGFSLLSRDLAFALDDEMNVDFEQIHSFCARNRGKEVLVFGFTYILWKHLYLELEKVGKILPLDRGILFHGGGWKHLVDQKIDAREFKKNIEKVTGIKRIHNYYGMAEQTGSIFVECQFDKLHCPVYSDISILRPDLSKCAIGEVGLVQVDSILPWSYPGHSILTEDRGEILGVDDCPCGRFGKYFRIQGRMKNSEIKGCSDSYAR